MKDQEHYEEDGNFFVGLFWATIFSIPLWMSIIGWGKIIFKSLELIWK